MTFDKSLFLDSRKTSDESNADEYFDRSEFEDLKHPVIPPVGIAEPALVEKSLESIENPEELRSYIDELERYKKETPGESIKRETLAHSARAFEGLAGFWGDMQEFMTSLTGFSPPQKEGKTFEDLKTPWLPDIESLEGPGISYQAPTTAELRQQTKETTGQYLEPKTRTEEASQEVTQDIGSMFAAPGLSWWQKLAAPIIGQSGKQVVKSFGGSEKAQQWTKLGLMVGSSLMNLGNAPLVARNAVRQAERMIPEGVSFSAEAELECLKKLIEIVKEKQNEKH